MRSGARAAACVIAFAASLSAQQAPRRAPRRCDGARSIGARCDLPDGRPGRCAVTGEDLYDDGSSAPTVRCRPVRSAPTR